MTIFKYYIDTTGGYVEYNPVNNNLIWENSNVITPAIFIIKVSGNITFVGSEYTTLKNYRDAGHNYANFKIEQFETTWQTIFEGNLNLRGRWDENEMSITFNEFNNINDYYDNFLSNYTIKWGLSNLGLSKYVINSPSVTTTTRDAIKVAGTGLNPTQYIAAYDINGVLLYSTTYPDPYWAYFLFRSTNPDGSHNFESMTLDFFPGEEYLYNHIVLFENNDYLGFWAKLPTSIGSSEIVRPTIAKNAKRFGDVIQALLLKVNSALTFTEGTAITYTGQSDSGTPYSAFNIANYLITEAADVARDAFKGSTINLKYCLEIMEKAFNLFWYLDGTALKFKHSTELGTIGALDLSIETQYLKRLEYITKLPDIEIFETFDLKGIYREGTTISPPWGKVQIYYRENKSDLIKQETKINTIPFNSDVTGTLSGLINTDKEIFMFMETTNNSSIPRIIYTSANIHNQSMTPGALMGHLNKWRFGNHARLASGLKVYIPWLGNIDNRPLLKTPIINYYIDLLTNYDMYKLITTSIGDGKTKSIKQNLNSNYAKLEIEI